MCLKILTQGRSPRLSVKISLFNVFIQLLTIHELTPTSDATSLCFCSVLCLLCLCARLFNCALLSPAGKGLTSWLSFVVSYCDFVTFPLVSWVGCGTWLYRFLIFAPLLTVDIKKNKWKVWSKMTMSLFCAYFGGQLSITIATLKTYF